MSSTLYVFKCGFLMQTNKNHFHWVDLNLLEYLSYKGTVQMLQIFMRGVE